MDILMVKTAGGQLAPLADDDAEALRSIKLGHVVECKIVKKRNPVFHRKWWALMQTGYEAWTETAGRVEYQGQPVRPNFDRFRKDITILAGYYEPTFDINDGVHLQAKSISFSSMEEPEFEQLYSACIDVILERILTKQGYTEESLREHVDRVLLFD